MDRRRMFKKFTSDNLLEIYMKQILTNNTLTSSLYLILLDFCYVKNQALHYITQV